MIHLTQGEHHSHWDPSSRTRICHINYAASYLKTCNYKQLESSVKQKITVSNAEINPMIFFNQMFHLPIFGY